MRQGRRWSSKSKWDPSSGEEQDRVVKWQLRVREIGEAFLPFKATSRLSMWVIGEALLPLKATSRLRTWLIGVL